MTSTDRARQDDTSTRPQRWRRLRAIRGRVYARPGGRLIWRVGVTVLGVLVILGGVVLLPLPGPGWLIIFAGMGILATEYPWAKRLMSWTKAKLQEWTAWLKTKPRWMQVSIGALGLIFLAAVLYGVYLLPRP